MKNKLTLKALKKELDLIKASKTQDLSNKTIDPNIKNSYINNLHMILRENSMLLLYVISGIISYAHKIPFIGRIISLASLYYGRTTIWKILVKFRKAFILFNALIGVFMVYNTVGFSIDNLLAGFMGMGQTYFEILTNITKRLFNWFVELFDHKVVPNVPGEPKTKPSWFPGSSGSGQVSRVSKDAFNPFLSSNDLLKDGGAPRLRDLYKTPASGTVDVNINTNTWYNTLGSIVWRGSAILGTAVVVGFIYSGYKFITDPTYIETLFSTDSTPKINPSNFNPDGTPSPDITLTGGVTKGLGIITSSVGSAYNYTTNKLNPFNWFSSQMDIHNQFKMFMEKQYDMVTADRRYYPFTEINPYLPWYKQLKLQLFGESISESLERFKDRSIAEKIYNSLQVSKGKFTDVTAATPIATPTPNYWLGNVGIKASTIGSGLNTPTLGHNIWDSIINENITNRINSLTPAPSNIPIISDNNPIASTSKALYSEVLNNNSQIPIPSTSKLIGIDVHNNKFNILSEINI